jgi:Methyltransferase domain
MEIRLDPLRLKYDSVNIRCGALLLAGALTSTSPMFGTSLKYFLQHPSRLVAALSGDPVEAWIKFQDRYAERRERRVPLFRYHAEADWHERLHSLAGFSQPCVAATDFPALWTEVMNSLIARGIDAGPAGFGNWNDGDAGLARAIWCIVLHLKPSVVVETGVGHGVTSRFILQAMERNGGGHLSSIDLPPLAPDLRAKVGIAVVPELRHRWTYIKGSSRRRLPSLLKKLGKIDLFIHDSLHSKRNLVFELDSVWPLVRSGGIVVVDDIDANDGFESFRQDHPDYPYFVCESEPVRVDVRRFNNKGLFGIIIKTPK